MGGAGGGLYGFGLGGGGEGGRQQPCEGAGLFVGDERRGGAARDQQKQRGRSGRAGPGELDAEKAEAVADSLPDERRVFSDPRRERERVQSAERGREGADPFLRLVAEQRDGRVVVGGSTTAGNLRCSGPIGDDQIRPAQPDAIDLPIEPLPRRLARLIHRETDARRAAVDRQDAGH